MEVEKGTAYWCKTKKIAMRFLRACDKQGILWYDAHKATEHSYHSVYGWKTCYAIRRGIAFCDTNYCKERGLKIIKVSKKTFGTVDDFSKITNDNDNLDDFDINSARYIYDVLDGWTTMWS